MTISEKLWERAISMTAVTGRALPVEFLRDFGSRWDAAWNSHETGEVLELLHPEIVW